MLEVKVHITSLRNSCCCIHIVIASTDMSKTAISILCLTSHVNRNLCVIKSLCSLEWVICCIRVTTEKCPSCTIKRRLSSVATSTVQLLVSLCVCGRSNREYAYCLIVIPCKAYSAFRTCESGTCTVLILVGWCAECHFTFKLFTSLCQFHIGTT